MNRCESFQEKLTLYCTADLGPEEAREVERHLASCEACQAERKALEATVRALDPPAFFTGEAEVDWDRFAAETAAMAVGKVVPLRRRILRPAVLARAAAVVLAVGLGWIVLQQDQKVMVNAPPSANGDSAIEQVPPPDGEGATALPVDFQRRLEYNLAREDTRQYLAESRDVLLSVLDSPVRCAKNELDIAAERQKSIELLRRKKLLRDDLDRPELARAAELCNRLEGILTEISTLGNCADLERIRELRDAVKRNQLLVKIGVAQEELGGQRA